MTYTQKLEQWYSSERLAGRVVDLKISPSEVFDGSPGAVERQSRAIYETVTGVRETRLLDATDY